MNFFHKQLVVNPVPQFTLKMFDTTGICLICLHTNKRLKVIDQRMSDFHYALCDYDSVTTLGNQYCVECAYLLNKVYNFTAKCQLALKILQGEYKTKCKKRSIYTLLPSNGLGLWDENEIGVYHFEHCEETTKSKKNSSTISNKDNKLKINSVKDVPSVKPDCDLQLLVIPNIFTEELIPKTVILIQSIVDSNKHLKNVIASNRGVQDVFAINKSIQNNAASNKGVQNIYPSNILIQNAVASNYNAKYTANAKIYTQTTVHHNGAKELVQNTVSLNPNVQIIINANESTEELKDPLSVDEDIKLENYLDSEVESSETDFKDEIKDKEKENTSEGTDDIADDIDINKDYDSNETSDDIPCLKQKETINNAEKSNETSLTSFDIPKYTLRKRTSAASRENVLLTEKKVIQTRNNRKSLNSRTTCDPVNIVSNYSLRKRKNLEKEKIENGKHNSDNDEPDSTDCDTDTIISNAGLSKRKTVMEGNKKGKQNTGVIPPRNVDESHDSDSDTSITKDSFLKRKSIIRDEHKKGISKTEFNQTRNIDNSTNLESDIKETSIAFDDHDYINVTETQKQKSKSVSKPSQVPKKLLQNDDIKEQKVPNRRRTKRVVAKNKIQRSVRKRKISGDSTDDNVSLCVVPKQCKSMFKNTIEVYDKERYVHPLFNNNYSGHHISSHI